jgi:hypothetical protein
MRNIYLSKVWWCPSIVPALTRIKQDLEFKVSLGYTVRLCLKNNNKESTA